MTVDTVDTLSELIAIPSVNPMGRGVTGPEYLEAGVTDYLEACFQRLGLPWQRQTVEPKRDNIVARLDGDRPGLVMFEVHQDTVPVDGMSIEPFQPEIRDGRIYGRGSCDIKGGMAAMIAAVARLADERPSGMPTVVLACSVNEEYGYTGAAALTQLWSGDENSIIPRRPDAVIVAEPTLLDVVVAHRGIVRWTCRTHGRAAHTSQPELGDNAIYKMSRVIQAFEQYYREVVPTLAEHPLCGRPTISVSTIQGGISVNTVPDACSVEIDRRLVPGETPEPAYQHAIEYVRQHSGVEDVEHEPPYRAAEGLSHDNNSELAAKLAAAALKSEPKCELIGVPYGTDASAIAQAGVPTVVFGPGSIDQAHTADEWLEIDQLHRAAEIYYRFVRDGWE